MSADSPQISPVLSSTQIEAANKLSPKLLLVRKRLTALAIDAVAIGFVSQATFALVCLTAQKMSVDLGESAGMSASAFTFAFAFGAIDAITGCLLIAALIVATQSGDPYGFLHYLIPVKDYWLAIVAGVVSNFFYHVVFETAGGATPGKLITKLRVVRANGSRLSFIDATVRHLTKCLSLFLISSFPLVWTILCNRRQMVHDRFAKTMVDVRNSVLIEGNSVAPDWSHALSVVPAGQIAGIPRRVVSAVIDSVIYYFIESLATIAIVFLLSVYVPIDFSIFPSIPDEIAFYLLFCVTVFPVAFTAPPLVMAAFESSPLQATPGKIIMGMRVISLDGSRCAFFQSLEKQFVQGVLYMSMFPTIVVFLLLLTIFNQSPMWIGITVILFLLVYGVILCWTLGSGQTLIDNWSKRFVVLESLSGSDVLMLKESGASK